MSTKNIRKIDYFQGDFMPSETMPERLKLARKRLGLNQKEMAKLLGVSQSNISSYEGGLHEPNSKALSVLSENGINLNWLLTGEGEMLRSDVVRDKKTAEIKALKNKIAEISADIERLEAETSGDNEVVDRTIKTITTNISRKKGKSLDFNVIVAMSNVLNVSLNYLAYGEEKELLKTNSLNLETIKQSAQQILTSIEKIQNPIIEPYQEHSSKIKLTKEPLPPEQDEPFNYINCYGSIAAGTPINLTGEVTDTVAISAKLLTDKAENYFCLHVKGKSMIRAGINDGDTVLLHKADTPIAGKIFAVIDVADDSVTLKRLEVDEEDGNLLLVWLDGSGKTIPLTDKHVVRGEYVRVI
jgi:SOS-response transcriptional repressor LexA